ncbi:hypothetical protein HBI25_216480 [Parastagonospora nodorum]|nr:hypothetical protein HBI25_216480 [Parastagonospora nodorum]KAH5782306.1 hypothetical protein HBI97_101130 [Parastagonospora nodorum]KAH5808526.1 hypothetical protein HBI96_102300 [Parastagonospora nodorum]KAH5819655.1 hypothetical protein HBI93_185380 [Parastagonospora nodorum]KAH5874397.1 hypothetical protein HBI90_078380 [Parastagonospora nodorum]
MSQNQSWPNRARIAHACAFVVDRESRIKLSFEFLIAVIAFNVLKVVVMLWVLLTDRSEYLVTLGDAVVFLQRPNAHTAAKCILDKEAYPSWGCDECRPLWYLATQLIAIFRVSSRGSPKPILHSAICVLSIHHHLTYPRPICITGANIVLRCVGSSHRLDFQLTSTLSVTLLSCPEKHVYLIGELRRIERSCMQTEGPACYPLCRRSARHVFLTASVQMGDTIDDYKWNTALAHITIVFPG